MPVSLKNLVGFFVRFSGISLLLRYLLKHKVIIIYYHNPRPQILEMHLRYLSQRYNIIALDTMVEAIYSGEWSKLPPRSLVITLDDGYKENFNLLAIFKQYNIVPTIYVCSQIVGTCRQFWFKLPIAEKEPQLWQYMNRTRLQYLAQEYEFQPTREYAEQDRQALSEEEITLMKDYVDFQVHTRFHPILTKCSQNECEEEIADAKKEVEEMIGRKCKHFSYPRGVYSDRETELVKKAKYASARTCDVGWNDAKTNPYKLKTIAVPDDASIAWLVFQFTRIPQYLRRRKIKRSSSRG